MADGPSFSKQSSHQATRRNETIRSQLPPGSSSNSAWPNKQQNPPQNSLLRRTQFWVRSQKWDVNCLRLHYSEFGADQCCSLTDSPGARAAKSVPMARFCGAVIRQLLHSLGEWNFTAGDSAPNRKNEFDEYLSCDRSGRNGHGNE